ncbi:MAG: hypothetical protein F2817_20015 [Actinobacteria bacterium]|nr:hypothetical protein [Actinomycetota bacterium]
MLPRLPIVDGFFEFVDAGRRLAELHLNYETITPFPLGGLDIEPRGDAYDFFAVKKMKFGKATAAQKAAGMKHDRTVIVVNDKVALRDIPDEAHRYNVGTRSAIEWLLDRYRVKLDKTSGITNDPNAWSREIGDPRYIVDLIARVVAVSVATIKIVDELPSLETGATPPIS